MQAPAQRRWYAVQGLRRACAVKVRRALDTGGKALLLSLALLIPGRALPGPGAQLQREAIAVDALVLEADADTTVRGACRTPLRLPALRPHAHITSRLLAHPLQMAVCRRT